MTRPQPVSDRADALIAAGRAVLRTEAEALLQLVERLDHSFVQAVELMLAATGRIVVSGMGKSGHVGRKIAATLASTGTPAQFVHPAEASHGDLGMVTVDDVVLLLSNSGETPELAHIIAHTRRFGIPLIGVASRRDSTMMRQADIALALPAAAEACPNGLAPTTSTTLTLALGDALAVALMQEREFTPEHFRLFHPGGNLGARLISVRDLMHTGDEMPLTGPATPMSDVLITMTQKGLGVCGVQDGDGRLIGIITDGDLRRKMDGLLTLTAGEVMTAGPQTVPPDLLAVEALATLNTRAITALFVLEGERPVGVLHIHDCLRAGLDAG
ncbi:MAG: KpsF/GutQ family sugar-phosphate isomerase [Pseudomonadota bacterium]